MRVGTFAYATRRGLGHLAHDFYTHGIITDILVVRHPGVPTVEEWYPNAPQTQLRHLDTRLMQDFAAQMDVMLWFETAFWMPILPFCRERGIKTFIAPMYECWQTSWPQPHQFLCPSLLDMEYFPRTAEKESIFLPLPTEYPWRLRERAEHWCHRGGYLGLRGREGTTLLIEAMKHVRSPLRLSISVQENVSAEHQRLCAHDHRIDYTAATIPYEDLYAVGDVAVMPQRFNGVSLPMQEACAAGLCVMASDRFPANSWLPKEPLIPVAGYIEGSQIGGAYMKFREAVIQPEDIAETMDDWYGQDVSAFSLAGKAWAESHSWAALGPRWKAILEA